jgi:hypothetical protein
MNNGRSKKNRRRKVKHQFAERDRKLRELGFTTYTEYVNSAMWRRRRREFYESRPRRCEVCGGEEGPVWIHHCSYERLGEESDNDLVCLCTGCHVLAHRSRRHFGWPVVRRMRAAFEECGDPAQAFAKPPKVRVRSPLQAALAKTVEVKFAADLPPEERARYALAKPECQPTVHTVGLSR